MTNSSTAIIILAAGSSSRLGLPKQLLQHNNESLLRHSVETALSAHPAEVLVVLGFEADRMKHEVDDLPVRVVLNSSWQEGIASSIKKGIGSLPDQTGGALILLCDQPSVTTDLLQKLISSCTDERPIAATAYNQTVGVPACYRRSIFGELLQLKGDGGAKRIIEQDPNRTAIIPSSQTMVDIDTLEDYQKYIQRPQ